MFEKSRNLLECHIAGFAYYDGLDVISKLNLGVPVTLKAEPDNPHDPDAVAIYYENVKLGYVPQVKNLIIGGLLYFGYDEFVEARINCHTPDADPERQFRIVVRLKDNRKK